MTGRRPDGFHELVTVFQRVSLHDRLTVRRTSRPGLVLRCSEPALAGTDNILFSAWELLRREYGPDGGVEAELEKNIPVRAGLGGGSADAAAFLTCCARLFHLPGALPQEDGAGDAAPAPVSGAFPDPGTPPAAFASHLPTVSTPEMPTDDPSGSGPGGAPASSAALLPASGTEAALLAPLAARLGSDVAACLYPGASLGRGRGELLTPLHSRLSFPLLILRPDAGCSTAAMYAALDRAGAFDNQEKVLACARALERGSLSGLCAALCNSFEQVLPPALLQPKEALLAAGAEAALLAGSGSCVFGIFASGDAASAAYQALSGPYQAFLCRTLP